MPFSGISFRRTESEDAIVEAIESTEPIEASPANGWFSARVKKMTALVIYMAVAVVSIWQIRSLHFNSLTVGGYLVITLCIFIAVTLIVAGIKLVLCIRQFYSQLHTEDYIASKEPASGAETEGGGGGDDMEDFVNFCRSEGFPLPGHKVDPESDNEKSDDMQSIELRF